MKKTNRTLFLLSCLTALTTACAKENLPQEPGQEGLSITMIAETADTKTMMNEAGDNVLWTGTDKLNIYLDGVHHIAKKGGITQEVLPDGKLKMTINGVQKAPKSTINGFIGAESSSKVQIGSGTDAQHPVTAFGIILPAEQNITSKTFDPLADVLVMEEKNVDGHEFTKAVTGIRYHRLHAVTRLNFTNMAQCDGEIVKSVAFSAVDGPALAGNFRYDFKNQVYLDPAALEPASSDHLIFAEGASSTITMTYSDQAVVTGGEVTAWMVAPAIALPAATKINIKITTDKHIFTKEQNIPTEVPMSNRQLNVLNIDMSGMQSSDAIETVVYRLVTKANELMAGGEYYLCSNENKVFTGELPKGGDGLSLTAKAVTINPDNTVSNFTTGQAIILEKGGTKGTFKMKMPGKESKDAYLSIGTKKGNGKLAFTNGSNSTSWNISINGTAEAVITDTTKQIFSYSTYLQSADKTTAGTLPKLIWKTSETIVPEPEPEPETPVIFSSVQASNIMADVKITGIATDFTYINESQTPTGVWYSTDGGLNKTEATGHFKKKNGTIDGHLNNLPYGQYTVGVFAFEDGKKQYSEGVTLELKEPAILPGPQLVNRATRNVVYLQTPVNNPLNLLEYKLEDGSPFFDAVILFSADLNYNEELGRIDLDLNKNYRAILADSDTYIQPLRRAGIKVYVGLVGGHDMAGICQLSNKGAKKFAEYMADFCRFYNLDGVNLDDEYSQEPDVNNPLFDTPSPTAGARLAYELKKSLAAKCPWPTEVSAFAYSKLKNIPEVKDLETGQIHQPGEFIDFQVGNYAPNSTSYADYMYAVKPYGGMTKKQCSGSSVELILHLGGDPYQVSYQKLTTAGYGWIMWFSFCPDPNQVYNSPGRTDNYNLVTSWPLLKKAATDLYGKNLLLPQHYYTVTDNIQGHLDSQPHDFTAEQLDGIKNAQK